MEATKINGIKYYPPQEDYIAFDNEEDYAEKGRAWGLFAKTPKAHFWYKSAAAQHQVSIKGYQEYGSMSVLIVEFEDGRLTSIHPSYLKEMQSGTFGKEPIGGEAEDAEGGVPSAADPDVSGSAEEGGKPAKAAKAQKRTKEKKEKLELPVDKVKFTAKVKEFTTKPNPFSDRDDEVVLLEEVAVVGDSPLAIGDAWCGYSNTLKGLGLEVGNVISFEGKVVDKKFNKEILYKVNNPSKIVIQ
ncbi:hypothetical protein B1A99_10485 [Cohnella sp. CIP 111063]|uniref:hypothetical protein n=1 Tax=unclassified Cohnella TaxID=2636738 RepID=UPI000B8C3C93|nr:MULTISPECIES: hypothetical protein [unclassified Cohnella]OXS59947.1 hypothetical protein B1A99_10485 [Cohnella sp. CIP 111063]PRX72757.1 hypothetical protein B0G52_105312 [Cohnella sp. SGD-V74]